MSQLFSKRSQSDVHRKTQNIAVWNSGRPGRPRFTSAPEFGVIPGRYFSWKPFLDLALAVLLVVPGLPLLGVLIVVVRMTSRPRDLPSTPSGKGRRALSMYKIRTMVHDAEATTGPVGPASAIRE